MLRDFYDKWNENKNWLAAAAEWQNNIAIIIYGFWIEYPKLFDIQRSEQRRHRSIVFSHLNWISMFNVIHSHFCVTEGSRIRHSARIQWR